MWFKVSAASAVRWTQLKDQTGSVDPRPMGGRRVSPLDAHRAWLLALNAEAGDLTLAEIVVRIADELGVKTSQASLRRFFSRHGISFKKTLPTTSDTQDMVQPKRRTL